MSTVECPNCHRMVNSDSRFCKYCGTTLPAESGGHGEIVCPHCRTVNRPNSHFCKHCGEKLDPVVGKEAFETAFHIFAGSANGSTGKLKDVSDCSVHDFLHLAKKEADGILLRAQQIKEEVLSTNPTGSTAAYLSRIDQVVEQSRMDFWALCDQKIKSSGMDGHRDTLNEGPEMLPKDRWDGAASPKRQLSSTVYVGRERCDVFVFGRAFTLDTPVYLDLLHKTNLLVRYNTETEGAASGFVTSLVGRWLKASLGHGISISVYDTQDFWGLGNIFNSLNPDVYNLVFDEHGAAQDLESLLFYERSVITNRLSTRTPTAQVFNQTHSDTIPVQMLVIRHFPQDVPASLDTLKKIMRNGARTGICVIIMADEDHLPTTSGIRRMNEFSLDAWEEDALTVDFVHQHFPSVSDWDAFSLETLDEKDLCEIIDDANESLGDIPASTSLNMKDFLPDPKDATPLRRNRSLLLGINRKTFAQKWISFNDMTVGNSLLVSGTRDSVGSIRSWMKAVALYALSCYLPSSLTLVFCDFSDEDSFAEFRGKLANVIVPRRPTARLITTTESGGFILFFAVGIGTLPEKDLRTLGNAPRSMKRGCHLILEDTSGTFSTWSSQKMVFGPSEIRGESFSETEFLFDGEIIRSFSADNDTVEDTLDSVLSIHPNLSSTEPSFTAESYDTAQAQEHTANSEERPDGTVNQFAPADPYAESLSSNGPLYLRDHLVPVQKRWTYSAVGFLEVPIGINPWNDKVVSLEMTQSDSGQNAAFIIGLSRSGKSNLLHTIILTSAFKYSPDTLQMYLIDLSGAEFKSYATFRLPHARTIAPQAEREHAMSILNDVEDEARRREEILFRQGVKDFSSVDGIPRLLVIIDEYPVLFEEDDDITTRSVEIIHRIINKYGKFGINLILATQKLPSSSRLDYNLINDRMVFNCKPDDFTSLFGASVRQPALGKGECIYTSKGRIVSSLEESEVKTYFADIDHLGPGGKKEIEEMIDQINAVDPVREFPPAKVFLRDREIFFSSDRMGTRSVQKDIPEEVHAYLGEPVAVGEDIFVKLDGSSLDNIVIVGGLHEVAQSIAIHALLSVADAYTDGGPTCYVFPFTKAGQQRLAGSLPVLCGNPFSNESKLVPMMDYPSTLKKMRDLIKERQKDFSGQLPHIYLLFLEFQNSPIDMDAKTALDFILKYGPQCGVFSVIQTEKYSFLRERGADMSYFNHRIALQMPRDDSQAIIRTYAASKLNNFTREEGRQPGVQLAVYYNANYSISVKFKPYSYRALIVDNQ